jgi:hypothetical protein
MTKALSCCWFYCNACASFFTGAGSYVDEWSSDGELARPATRPCQLDHQPSHASDACTSFFTGAGSYVDEWSSDGDSWLGQPQGRDSWTAANNTANDDDWMEDLGDDNWLSAGESFLGREQDVYSHPQVSPQQQYYTQQGAPMVKSVAHS